jgi:hydrogenase maturation factor
MNAVSLRKVSRFVRAGACCRAVLNAAFFYNFMEQVAEISASIIYAVNVMRDALRGGLWSPRKEV